MSAPRTRVPIKRILLGVSLTTAMVVLAGSAWADPTPIVRSTVNVSGRSPFPVGCIDSPFGDGLPQNSEPAIAVNPRDPRQQVAQWTDNTAGTTDTAFTSDGGRHWVRSLPNNVDPCTGRAVDGLQWAGTSDPWLSWSPFGRVYMSSLPWTNTDVDTSNYHVFTAVSSTTARDHFRWSRAVDVPNPLMTDDKDSILADNKVPNLVYVDNRNAGFGLVGEPRGDGQLLFDRSTDGGKTWTHTVIADANNASTIYGVQNLVQLANGRLVEGSSVPASQGGGTRAFWSTDRGLTWNGPGAAQPTLPRTAPLGPYCGSAMSMATDGGQVTVLNGKTILEVDAVNETTSGPGDIYMFSSNDGGQTWSDSLVYQSSFPVIYPTISTNQDGQIGLLFDQVNTSAVTCLGVNWAQLGGGQKMIVPARTQFVVSDTGGQTWSRPATVGAPWWNFASAPIQTEFFELVRIGDYQQLAGYPGGFASATIEGQALAPDLKGPEPVGFQPAIVSEIATSPFGQGH